MIALKHILVPTDFSETSDAAVRYGIAFAKAFHATLHLLHVASRQDLEVMLEGYRVVEAELPDSTTCALALEDVIEKGQEELLGRLLTDQDRQGLTTKYVLQESDAAGGPSVEIVRYAQSQEIDLIVLGTHGGGAMAHMLMGSVAERVVRKAPCPVLTVRHHEHEFLVPDEVESST